MCYEDKDRPPLPPGQPGPYHAEELVLEARDGNRFLAYLATPEQGTGSHVIIYPDVRGLHGFYRDLVERFAGAGITALGIDYFGRTAGLGARDDSFDFKPHPPQVKLETFSLDVQAALDYLRSRFAPARPTFVVGFCMGGSLTLLTGTNRSFGFTGLIPFYSGFTRTFGPEGTALDNAEKVAYPVLGLYGGADQGIPLSDVQKLDDALDRAGVQHEIVVYPGATHSFFDRRAAEFADASADAWRRVLAFIEGHALQS